MDNEELKAGNGDDDSEKLTFWKTRKNSLSDRLFQYFEVKSKSNYGTTLYVQCILCDPNKPLLSVTTGINSNLKTHLDRVSTHFGRFCYQPQLIFLFNSQSHKELMPQLLDKNGGDHDEIPFKEPAPAKSVKQEPSADVTDMSFEQIMVNDDSDRFNYAHEDSSSNDASSNEYFHETEAHSQPNQYKPPNNHYKSNTIPSSSNPEIQKLRIELLKKQIVVQSLMATELKFKINRTRQLMKMEAAESKLRCQEIAKRMQS